MVAVAGFVPWAESGTRTSVGALAARGVVSADHQDPGELAVRARRGLEVTASMPLISMRICCNSHISWSVPWAASSGAADGARQSRANGRPTR